jgi:hypothetical protein
LAPPSASYWREPDRVAASQSLTLDAGLSLAAARPTSTGIMARPISLDRTVLGISDAWRAWGGGWPLSTRGRTCSAARLRNASNGVLFGVAVCRDVFKVGNAGEEATVAFALDHCPIKNPVHTLSLYSTRKMHEATPPVLQQYSVGGYSPRNAARVKI